MEAWLHGAALEASLPPLQALLEGLSLGPPTPVYQLHVCLAAPPAEEDAQAVELHLTRDLTTPGSLWRVRHTARPMAGDRASKLPAAVREVREAASLSGDAYRLLATAGCRLQYQLMRRGFRYTLLEGAQAVSVALLLLQGQGEDGQPADLVPGLWLVEATCATSQEAYADAVHALAAVRDRVAGVVTLSRPALHLVRT